MSSRTSIAIEIGRRRVRAVAASRDQGRVEVECSLVSDVPASVDTDDAAALGAWIREHLDRAGFPKGRATIALAREHVGLKRLVLPTLDANELPDMTRLALQREMPFDAEQAVIDYVPLSRDGSSTTVLAVAAPARLLAHAREVAKVAGIGIERMALRVMGSASLLKSLDRHDHCTLAVDVTGSSVEFCVLEHGAIRFARAAEIPPPEGGGTLDAAAMIDAVITETRRTWMSFRIVEDAAAVERVMLMGDARVTADVAAPIAEILGAEATVLGRHPLVEPRRVSIDRVWPLVGLLLESTLGHETIDFERPRQPVDKHARTRRRAIMAAGLVAVLLLAGWTVGMRNLRVLRGDLDALRTRVSGLEPQVARYERGAARFQHLERWESIDVRWLEHLAFLEEIAPAPNEVVLDGWTGSLRAGDIRYDKRREKKRRWSVTSEISLVVEGEAKDRITADALRAALVRPAWYDTRSTGAESRGSGRLPFAFTFHVSTGEAAPPATPGEATP
ncbi:MAG: pilus assembly protein PilM [Planctomycetes bacterium]|nr:pilus assembly protein PilM [Planctomycetota bacterium]